MQNESSVVTKNDIEFSDSSTVPIKWCKELKHSSKSLHREGKRTRSTLTHIQISPSALFLFLLLVFLAGIIMGFPLSS